MSSGDVSPESSPRGAALRHFVRQHTSVANRLRVEPRKELERVHAAPEKASDRMEEDFGDLLGTSRAAVAAFAPSAAASSKPKRRCPRRARGKPSDIRHPRAAAPAASQT